jgi:predicted TIM-barrel fold metal-dependent hydrolase
MMKQDSLGAGETAADPGQQNGRSPAFEASRREILRALAALGVGAIWPATGLFARAAKTPAAPGKRGRIDVHHHMLPPFQTSPPFVANRHWMPEVALATMEKFGTDIAILSLTSAAEILYDGTEKARTFARRANEYGAKLVSDSPKRFGLFASLPLPDQDGSLREIEYAFDTLKADGIGLFTDTGDKWPGDPAFLAVFEELNRRKAVVFFHPTAPNCCRNLVAGVGDGVIEYDFDTTRAITSLLYNGVLSRMPDIRFIVSHSGAAVPVLAGRIKDRVPGASSNAANPGGGDGKTDRIPNGVYHELKKLYYECAHATYPPAMAALTRFAAGSQILFGTDYPMEPYETTVNEFPNLGFSAELQQAIDRGNAERLFPQFKA